MTKFSFSSRGAYGHGGNLVTFTDRKDFHKKSWGANGTLENPDGQDDTSQSRDIPRIKKKIRRVIQRMRITYRVLLDPSGQVGSRFNGQELPTNVLIDKDGFVR